MERGRSDSCTSVEGGRGSKRVARSPAGEEEDELHKKLRIWKGEIVDSLKEIMEEQGKRMREEIEVLKKEIMEFKERESRWERERRDLVAAQEEMRKSIEKMDSRGDGMLERRVKELEKKMEMKDREERRRNIIIRGVTVKEGKRREAVEGLFREIGAKVTVKGVKRIGEVNRKGKEMIWVRLEDEGQRKEVWNNKKKLRGREERILEDWTWKERKMRWSLEKIARAEEEKGIRVWIGYGRIRIGESWWRWDEEEEVLKNERGEVRVEDSGKEEGGRM